MNEKLCTASVGWPQLLATALLAMAFAAATHARDLPDFTELVKENSSAVVNISTVRRRQDAASGSRRQQQEIEEFFRRFMPPDGRRQQPPNVRPRSLGSGFVISDDGYLLTNNHVVEGADKILVRFSDRSELEAELVGADPRSDLALLKVDANDLPTVRLGTSSGLEVGEWVLAIGSPFGFEYSVTAGIVSAKGRSLPTEQNENYVPFIQTDVAINPGNSGGPLFNLDGRVVGINSQIYSNSGGFMGVSFAIPIDVAMEVVEQLKAYGKVSRGWLGVVIQEVDRDLADSFGLERPHGALVAQVLENSPAEAGGILEADIIVAFNDQPIDFSSELPHLVGRVRAGSKARLEIIRDGKQENLTVAIGELPDRGDERFAARGDGGAFAPAKLGLRVEDVPDAVVERLNLSGGVRVLEVEGPAAEATIRPGDIITRLNNREVSGADEFLEIAEDLPPGKSVAVLVLRGQAPLFLALKVPE